MNTQFRHETTGNPYYDAEFRHIPDTHTDNWNELASRATLITAAMQAAHTAIRATARADPHNRDFYHHELSQIGWVHMSHGEHELLGSYSLDALDHQILPNLANIKFVEQRYAQGDAWTERYLTDYPRIREDEQQRNLARIGGRLAQLPGKPRAKTDVDGSLTYEIPGQKDHYYSTHIAGTLLSKAALKAVGEHAFPQVYPMSWRPPQIAFPKTLQSVGEGVKLRDGIPELVAVLEEMEWSGGLLSTGFDPFIEGVRQNIGPSAAFFDPAYSQSVSPNNISAINKVGHILRLVGNDPLNPVVFIGDGGSDQQLVNHSVLAGCCALNDGKLQASLRNEDAKAKIAIAQGQRPSATVPHDSYDTYHDVAKTMQGVEKYRRIMIDYMAENQAT